VAQGELFDRLLKQRQHVHPVVGFIGSYFMVCLAAPFFLLRRGELTVGAVAVSVVALLLLCVVMTLSVYPAPAAPACYLPYIFLGILGLGLSATTVRRRSPATFSLP